MGNGWGVVSDAAREFYRAGAHFGWMLALFLVTALARAVGDEE